MCRKIKISNRFKLETFAICDLKLFQTTKRFNKFIPSEGYQMVWQGMECN